MAVKSNLNFFVALLIVLLAGLLEFRLAGWLDFRANFLLATLIALAFFIGFTEFAALIIIAAWMLNWQPAVGWELAVFMFIPLLSFAIKRFPPWKIWLSNIIFVALGILLFYSAADYSFLAGHWTTLLKDLTASLIWSASVFAALSSLYQFKLRR